MLVRAVMAGDRSFWIGEAFTTDGRPIESVEALAQYLEHHDHVLLYVWAAGEVEQRRHPKLVNRHFVESWEETVFTDVIKNLPEKRPRSRRRHKGRRRRSASESKSQ